MTNSSRESAGFGLARDTALCLQIFLRAGLYRGYRSSFGRDSVTAPEVRSMQCA